MDNFLLAIGYWNLFGSVMMLFFLNEKFGQLVLNEWTNIFATEFKLNYWVKLWLFWAAGINIFFGLINVLAVSWGYTEVKLFLLRMDLLAYLIFILASFWGWKAGRLGQGFYIVVLVFLGWIVWGSMVYPMN